MLDDYLLFTRLCVICYSRLRCLLARSYSADMTDPRQISECFWLDELSIGDNDLQHIRHLSNQYQIQSSQ
jgi:hypothetical protein